MYKNKKTYIISLAVIFIAGLFLGYIFFNKTCSNGVLEEISFNSLSGEKIKFKCIKKDISNKDVKTIEYQGKKYIISNSPSNFSFYENTMIDSMSSFPLPEERRIKKSGDFKNLIKDSLGWDNLYPKDNLKVNIEKQEPYFKGQIDENIINYSFPKIEVRFLYAKHKQEISPERDLIIILHGHGSSSYKVMGLDNADYMQKSGEEWFKKGFDIIAFDTTSLTEESSYLNSQLLLYGVQINGLWSRAVCDIVRGAGLNEKYNHVYLYGLSNGGFIADFVSILCPYFDKIIIGDIISDWRNTIKENLSIFKGENYNLFFLRPLWFETSYLDFIIHNGGNPKYYTRSLEEIENLISGKIDFGKGINNSSVNFVFKNMPYHIVESDLIMDIIKESSNIKGYYYIKK